MIDVVETIRQFNAGRDPQRLAIKYRKLSASRLAFLRGTCHLFYDRLPIEESFSRAPRVWACGDLHLENFGSRKGDDGLVYFDINDFDEAALATAPFDLVRLLTSVLVADSLQATPDSALGLCTTLVQAHGDALASGKAGPTESKTARGPIGRFLKKRKGRSRVEFLDDRTESLNHLRTIRCDGQRAFEASAAERERVAALIGVFVAEQQLDPAFFAVRNVARRIAGTGSLGVERYAVLVEGEGSPDGNHLLDLKRATPSTLASRLTIAQPPWLSQAHRVVEIQRRLQAAPMAFLHPVVEADTSYVLRRLQPSEVGLTLDAQTPPEDVAAVLQEMGRALAWAQLRSAGYQGSATIDELVDYAISRATWQQALIGSAQRCAAHVANDFQTYRTAYEEGAFSDT